MGKRGPKPKLASIQKLEGNSSKRPIEELGIVAAGEAFAPGDVTLTEYRR
jgi:hypothetical protein